MKECMKIRKGLSALTAALVVTGMLGIGAVEEIKEQIVVEANTQAYSYACLNGAQKEIMTVAYTNTVYNEKDYNTLCRIVEAEAGVQREDQAGEELVGYPGGGETGTGRGGLFQRRAVFCGQTVCGLRQYALV